MSDPVPSTSDRVERFDPEHEERSPRQQYALGNDAIIMGPYPDGEWVRFEDHQRLLLAAEGERDEVWNQRDIQEMVCGEGEEIIACYKQKLETAEKHLVEVWEELERSLEDAELRLRDGKAVSRAKAVKHVCQRTLALLAATPSKEEPPEFRGTHSPACELFEDESEGSGDEDCSREIDEPDQYGVTPLDEAIVEDMVDHKKQPAPSGEWPDSVRLQKRPGRERLRFAPSGPAPGFEADWENETRVYVPTESEAIPGELRAAQEAARSSAKDAAYWKDRALAAEGEGKK